MNNSVAKDQKGRSLASSLSTLGGNLSEERVLVLDFGSQYAQLIARRVREQNVYCEIVRADISLDAIRRRNPKGIILSGGPASVYEAGAPRCHPELFDLGIPVLGICYGMQLTCDTLGGKVQHSARREFGRASCMVLDRNGLTDGLPDEMEVWMSHGDQVTQLPEGFSAIAKTSTCPMA
ncbi:MAG: synthase, partial [Planctomycetota bacterium]